MAQYYSAVSYDRVKMHTVQFPCSEQERRRKGQSEGEEEGRWARERSTRELTTEMILKMEKLPTSLRTKDWQRKAHVIAGRCKGHSKVVLWKPVIIMTPIGVSSQAKHLSERREKKKQNIYIRRMKAWGITMHKLVSQSRSLRQYHGRQTEWKYLWRYGGGGDSVL